MRRLKKKITGQGNKTGWQELLKRRVLRKGRNIKGVGVVIYSKKRPKLLVEF